MGTIACWDRAHFSSRTMALEELPHGVRVNAILGANVCSIRLGVLAAQQFEEGLSVPLELGRPDSGHGQQRRRRARP
jgi:hypothetical protein